MLLLMAMLAAAGLGLILVSGWTAGPATMLTLWALTRHRRPSSGSPNGSPGAAAPPAYVVVAQVARDPVIDVDDGITSFRFPIRDRDEPHASRGPVDAPVSDTRFL
jgi:hypothetical protein